MKAQQKRELTFAAVVALLLMAASVVMPQSGGSFEITKSVIAGGGGTVSGGIFAISGTTGQCVAGTTSFGGMFQVTSGFWASSSAGTPTPTPTATPTATPSATPTSTPTPTPTATPTPGGSGFEGDIAPRPNGDGNMLATDVTQMRRFAAGLDTPDPAFNELQRADTAPRATLGNGALDAADVVQVRRYVAGLDPLTEAGGPLAPPPIPELGITDGLYHYLSKREVLIGQIESYDPATVTVPVEIVAVGDETAIGFTLEYDASMLREPQVMLTQGAPNDAVLTVNYEDEGRLGILVDSSQAFTTGDAPIRFVTVTFSVVERGDTTIRITGGLARLGVSDGNGDLLVTRWRSRAIRID